MLVTQSNPNINAFTALAYARLLVRNDDKRLYNTNLDLCLHTAKQSIAGETSMITIDTAHYYPRISVSSLKRVYKGAKAQELTAFAAISNLYAVGLGVPISEELCRTWSALSTKTCPGANCITYKQALSLLKEHIKWAISRYGDGNYVYFGEHYSVLDAAASLFHIPKAKSWSKVRKHFTKVANDDIAHTDSINVSLVISGLPVLLFYKNTVTSGIQLVEVACKLDDKVVSLLEYATKFKGIPFELSKHNESYAESLYSLYKDRISASYDLSPKYHHMFIVQGVLTVPKSKLTELKQACPNITNTTELVRSLLTFDEIKHDEELAAARHKKPKREKIEEFVLRKKYANSVSKQKLIRAYLEAKKKATPDPITGIPSIPAKEIRAAASRGISIEKFEARVESIYKKRSADLLQDLANVRNRHPAAFLHFVGQNIYGYDSRSCQVESIPIPVVHREQHLSSAGFYTVWQPYWGITRIYYGFKDISISKLKQELKLANSNTQQYKVIGFQIEPNVAVKTAAQLPRIWINPEQCDPEVKTDKLRRKPSKVLSKLHGLKPVKQRKVV